MNQLPIAVIDFARHRRAAAARWPAAADEYRPPQQAAALVCQWRRDPATGQLNCAWTARKGAREARPPSPVQFRKLKELSR